MDCGTELNKRKLSDDTVPAREEEPLSILDLPLELTTCIIQNLNFLTRIAISKSCLRLYNAEALAKLSIATLALYRTGDDEFTLCIKDKFSDYWKAFQNVAGENVARWMDDDDFSYKSMKEESRDTPFQENATPLGDLAPIIQNHLNRSTIDTLDIDGFHFSDSSMAQMCAFLRGKWIDHICLSAPFSTTSDVGLYGLIHNSPKLGSMTLAIHRCTPKDKVLEKNLLLLAASRLKILVVHSKVLRGAHSEDHSVVDDDLLIRLLSAESSHLSLLYYLPLLTAKGIYAAVKTIRERTQPKAEFKAYFRSELTQDLTSLLLKGLNMDTDYWSDQKIEITTYKVNPTDLRLTSYVKVKIAQSQKSHEYAKICVEKDAIKCSDLRKLAQRRIYVDVNE
ncbi:hypothetical protein PENTCL1PPCAC_22126 [Pristionchus entomophagus]|uniref:F-box domain-containing protein n=1 Tax=Pristionchus entomophagus TaxID=358040 RepID=A0AAV5U0I1_9BILA|nr:hypothetical protein PENTCL1PPCAC_22126 [Pristionchus entomophagus]